VPVPQQVARARRHRTDARITETVNLQVQAPSTESLVVDDRSGSPANLTHGVSSSSPVSPARRPHISERCPRLVHKPHFPMLRENNVRAGFFEREQYLAVLPHLPEPMRPVVTFAFVTGWRINSEVLPLEWRQVDLKAGEVRLDPGTTKNLEGRVFYLTAELKKLLSDQRKTANHVQRQKKMIVARAFFHHGTTKADEALDLAGHGISGSGFYHAWCRARIKAGCPASIPHDFRRTAIRNMVRAGVRERVAMKLSGHKTRSVFDRYNISAMAICGMRRGGWKTTRRLARLQRGTNRELLALDRLRLAA